ncbi:MAG: BamA/TamA family outer membrane protein [Vicinamibacterales bacterium]
MRTPPFGLRALIASTVLLGATAVGAQTPAPAPVPAAATGTNPSTVCGLPIPAPAALPPADSPPVIFQIVPCFAAQGNTSTVEPETYLFYIRLRPSLPSQARWVPYDDAAENLIKEDFARLWATNFLDDLSIETSDYVFSNGVVGKLIVYNLEERERVKVVDYQGSKEIDRTKIQEQLTERGIELRLDSFVDAGAIRRVETVLREMMASKGFSNAEVTHKTTPVAGGPKLVNVTFTVSEGPKIRIRRIDFVGNTAVNDGPLQRALKENKPKGILSFITGGGTYKEDKFEEDADRVTEYYRNRGYARVRVGQPELKTLVDEKDGKTRWVELRIPVTEGPRYKVGEFDFDGNTVLKADVLRTLFKVKAGDWYSEKEVRDGLRKAQEAYGGGGYMEFTGAPDLKFKNDGIETEADASVPAALLAADDVINPVVDVTMRLQEGKQYFVNRITFTGNSTTRDNVIRRELRLVEGGLFNTEALKFSVRRLNQLGYFKPLEGNDKDTKVDKTPGRDNAVDVTMRVEEQNRNQLTFGAGMSQYEGFFGQLGFQTSNFLGRGESLTLNMTAGSRSQNYQLSFTEPFLFDRNMTGGFDLHKRSLQYIGYYTQKSTGGNLQFGFPVADFARMFMTYSFEKVQVADLNEALIDPSCATTGTCSTISLASLNQLTPEQVQLVRRNPFVYDSLLIGEGGARTISKITPSIVHNTIDNPIFPGQGTRLTASFDLAGLGGNTSYYKPSVEGIWYKRHTSRTSIGFRGQVQYVAPYGSTDSLPIFERLTLGGEYSVRGYDIRSIGPTVPDSLVVLGGNKSLLFNAEYLITIAGPVRLILFYDAGQVRDLGQAFTWNEDVLRVDYPTSPLVGPSSSVLVDPSAPGPTTKVIGRSSAFKTSTGAEIRFFMPVLNVPFRLIFAANPQRAGVLTNNLEPAKGMTFRFAVGSTF